jgi:hypothetical protein
MKRLFALILAVAAVASHTGSLHAAGAPPVRLSFTKTLVSTVPVMTWKGSVTGDVTGDLETRLLNLRVSGAVWHVEFDWIVTNTAGTSFTARLTGTLNTNTGKVVMNGLVIDGYLEGAQVHEEGVLTDATASKFEGVIRIAPQSAE